MPPLKTLIKSFARREGRMTLGQKRAYEIDGAHYLVNFNPDANACELKELFKTPIKSYAVEIGFGMGDSLGAQALENPDTAYLGIEVYRPGIGHLLLNLIQHDLKNVRICEGDARTIFANHLADNSLDIVQVFFPDPWPKKRHHKRRILEPHFLELIWNKLKLHGRLHVATDWAEYAEVTLELLKTLPGWKNAYENFAPDTAGRPPTKFEQRGKRLGHEVFDLVFLKEAK